MQGLLQENGEMEVFPAIIPLYCTVFGGVLQRGMALMFWVLYLGTYRGTLSGNCFQGSIAERDGSGVLRVVSGDVSGDSFRELLSGEYCRKIGLWCSGNCLGAG